MRRMYPRVDRNIFERGYECIREGIGIYPRGDFYNFFNDREF